MEFPSTPIIAYINSSKDIDLAFFAQEELYKSLRYLMDQGSI
jgi:hypothetical protein